MNELEKEKQNIQKYIESVVSKKDIELTYQMLRECLYNDQPPNKIYILYGTGCNGKSTFLNFVEQLVGKENVCHVAINELFNKDSFKLINLKDKKVNLSDDIKLKSEEKLLKERADFKAIIGDNILNVEIPYHPKELIKNRTTHIFVGNNLDAINEYKKVFKSRIKVITFPNLFCYNYNRKVEVFDEKELKKFRNKLKEEGIE